MTDPYQAGVDTRELARLARAMQIIDEQAELNHRYRKLVRESRQVLDTEQIRLTQARGVAKKLMVLAKAAGSSLTERLPRADRDALAAGLAEADELVHGAAR